MTAKRNFNQYCHNLRKNGICLCMNWEAMQWSWRGMTSSTHTVTSHLQLVLVQVSRRRRARHWSVEVGRFVGAGATQRRAGCGGFRVSRRGASLRDETGRHARVLAKHFRWRHLRRCSSVQTNTHSTLALCSRDGTRWCGICRNKTFTIKVLAFLENKFVAFVTTQQSGLIHQRYGSKT